MHRDTLYFTFALGCSGISESVSRAFLYVLCFSLSGLFNSGFFYAGASKTQSFWVFTGFYYKNKRMCKGKMKAKDLKHNNQQVKQQDKNRRKAIFLKLRYTQDFLGQGATVPTPFSKLQNILRLTSEKSQPVPRYTRELWALHSGPIPIPILNTKTLNLKKIPILMN